MNKETAKKTAFGVVMLGFLLAAGSYTLSLEPTTDRSGDIAREADLTISITKDGFFPEESTIAIGDMVRFENNGDDWYWPASNLHPTHELYPAFDPREPVAPGESWSFTFTEPGAWVYHDHLRPNKRGLITVEESF